MAERLKELILALYRVSHRSIGDMDYPEAITTDEEKEMVLWANTAGHATRISEALIKLAGLKDEVGG